MIGGRSWFNLKRFAVVSSSAYGGLDIMRGEISHKYYVYKLFNYNARRRYLGKG